MLFPDVCSLKLVEKVAYFYARACDRQEEDDQKLLEQLEKRIGLKLSRSAVAAVSASVRERYPSTKRINDDWVGFLEHIRNALALQTTSQAAAAMTIVLDFSGTNDEHQACVLSTASLNENLLRELILEMEKKKRGHTEGARRKVEKMSLKDLATNFGNHSDGSSLEDAFAKLGQSDFYRDAREIAVLRNSFLHSNPYAIRQADAERAFKNALSSISVFAGLHNKFCVNPS